MIYKAMIPEIEQYLLVTERVNYNDNRMLLLYTGYVKTFLG